MILADTTIWADHLRGSDEKLKDLLTRREVLMHPFVLGEIALGFLRRREEILLRLSRLPQGHVADHEEVLHLVERQRMMGAGVGYVDVHLLTTTLTTDRCLLWTRDKKLGRAATRLGVAADPIH